jgi:hypothetical protein
MLSAYAQIAQASASSSVLTAQPQALAAVIVAAFFWARPPQFDLPVRYEVTSPAVAW